MDADLLAAMKLWLAVTLFSAAVLIAAAYTAGRYARRSERERDRRELARARQRLDTYAALLRPLADAARRGDYRATLPRADLAALALLVQHDGPDGEELAALDAQFHSGTR